MSWLGGTGGRGVGSLTNYSSESPPESGKFLAYRIPAPSFARRARAA
ncbi:MAG TPA: hypothetical protein VG672_26880 [Bryobacteraceae bacterium]|nr:hypothetical protein [Bryobacteraceae bacterium]